MLAIFEGDKHEYHSTIPDKFLEVRVSRLNIVPSLICACAGYELGSWRGKELADHAMDWLPEFSLNWKELDAATINDARRILKEAAERVFSTDKFKNRGEFGELLLHIAIRQFFNSIPAISKIYYKSSHNDTVKGFDSVHVVLNEGDLELWIGEAKFYSSISKAISDVVSELKIHTNRDYLRNEFCLIKGKINSEWPHANELKQLIRKGNSLDNIFKRTCIPVLLTYNSDTINNHTAINKAFKHNIEEEVLAIHKGFSDKSKGIPIRIHLILLPLNNKDMLNKELFNYLRKLRNI